MRQNPKQIIKSNIVFKYLLYFTLTLLSLVNPAFSSQTAVVATTAPDYSSGAISTIPVINTGNVQNNILPGVSDQTVVSHGGFFYRLNRKEGSIAKFNITSPSTPVWNFSTEGYDEGSNPHDMVFVRDSKAYVIRYGSTKAWIVNPLAKTFEGFKTGELDLSAYADADGVPDMQAAVIADGKLFILMQRLENWAPSNTGYVAVFDAATDQEIDTGMDMENGRKGIPLSVRNPISIQYLAENNTIYIDAAGSYPGYGNPDLEYTGGIVSLSPKMYATRLIKDDGTADDHPYGAFSGLSIISPSKGYFVGYMGWGDNNLYPFNPLTGAVADAVPAFMGKNIAGMENTTAYDSEGRLWICNGTDARVDILNVANESIIESISTQLNPAKVVFATPQILMANINGQNLTLDWNFSGEAVSYTLYYAPYTNMAAFGSFNIGDLKTITYTLASGTSLYVAISAKMADGTEVFSNVIDFQIP